MGWYTTASRRHLAHAYTPQEKHDYNVAYYKKHKQYWVDRYRLGAKANGADPITDAANKVADKVKKRAQDGLDTMVKKVGDRVQEVEINVDEETKEKIADKVVDLMEDAAREVADIGKRVVKKLYSKMEKSLQTSWTIGAESLDAGAREVNRMWKDGVGTIKSGIKSVVKTWKFGLGR